MKNTLIVEAEQLVNSYRSVYMEHIYMDMECTSPEDFARDLARLSEEILKFTYKTPEVAWNAFRNCFKDAGTISLLEPEDFEKLEAWYDANEDYQIVILRKDGSPIGAIKKEDISW